MKRTTILLMTLMLTIIQIAAQDATQKGTITLSHQGKETAFRYNEMTKVMDAAVDGDTVFLSAGYFLGDFIMTKKLALIGVGADNDNNNNNCTTFDGKIVIKFPENTKLTARLFDGINFTSNNNTRITFDSAIDNVIFRKCKWGRPGDFWKFQAEVKNLIVDRCNCYFWQNSSEKLTKLIVRNSNVSSCYISSGNPNSRVCYNCNISSPNFGRNDYTFSQLRHTFINCIIYNGGYLGDPIQNEYSSYLPIFINCLYYGNEKYDVTKNCTIQNCYAYTSGENSLESLSKEDLLKNNYLGNDGTVVGYYGGKNSYTLSMVSPIIKNTIHLDKDKKQIQFTLKITEQ